MLFFCQLVQTLAAPKNPYVEEVKVGFATIVYVDGLREPTLKCDTIVRAIPREIGHIHRILGHKVFRFEKCVANSKRNALECEHLAYDRTLITRKNKCEGSVWQEAGRLVRLTESPLDFLNGGSDPFQGSDIYTYYYCGRRSLHRSRCIFVPIIARSPAHDGQVPLGLLSTHPRPMGCALIADSMSNDVMPTSTRQRLTFTPRQMLMPVTFDANTIGCATDWWIVEFERDDFIRRTLRQLVYYCAMPQEDEEGNRNICIVGRWHVNRSPSPAADMVWHPVALNERDRPPAVGTLPIRDL